LLKQYVNIDGIAAYIAGGLIVFALVMLIIRLVFWAIIRLAPGDPHRLSTSSRFAGLLIGAVVGAAIALLLVYTWGIYQDAREARSDVRSERPPEAADKAARLFV